MKKLAVVLFSLAILLSFSGDSLAQSGKSEKKISKTEKEMERASAKHKAIKLTGWVRTEAGKIVFVNEKDKQSWNVANPDMLRGHQGMRVKVKAIPNTSDRSILVDEVKNLKQDENGRKKRLLIF